MRTLFFLLCLAVSSLSNAATLMIFGDSLSAGYGLETGTGWVHLLKDRYANTDIKIINASINGETTSGGVARLKNELEANKPSWVIIELGGNDGLRGLPTREMGKNIESMIDTVTSYGAQPILFGIRIPPNYGRRYTQKFEQVFSTVAEQYQLPYLPFFVEALIGKPELLQEDGIHPTAEAQPLILNTVDTFLAPILSAKE